MYKVSVIVPVYNVEKYLRTCMDSLVGQTLDDIEIIAVNDGSPDNSLSILEEYKSRYYPKVKVFTIENHGVSYARNYGVEQASGEYVAFVDSDDFVEPDYCRLMYEKAARDGNDVVLCSRNNIVGERGGDDVIQMRYIWTANQNFRFADHPYELVWLTPYPWDKLVRRELFRRVRFPENMRFEDLVYVLKLACLAENVGVVRTRLYNYHHRVSGGFLSGLNESTRDILRSVGSVVDFMRENGYLETFREEIEYIAIEHFLLRYAPLLEKGGAPTGLKKHIVNETHDFLNSNFPGWKNNRYLKYSTYEIIEKNRKLYCSRGRMLFYITLSGILPGSAWNRVMRLYDKARDTSASFRRAYPKRKWLLKRLKKRARVLRLLRMPPSYKFTKAYMKNKVDPGAILFESKHGEDIAGNMFRMLLCLAAPEFQKYRAYLAVNEETAGKWERLCERYDLGHVRTVALSSPEYYRLLASAKYLVTDTSFAPYFIKKTEQVYLNTWHGTPLKGMGRSVPEREFGLGNIQRNYYIADWLLYQNEFSRDIFLDEYMLRNIYPGRIMVSGYPRNSGLYQPKLGEQIRRESGLEGKQLIAYMPTWRGLLHLKNFEDQIREIYQYLQEIDSLLRDDQVFLVKLHPFVNDTISYEMFRHIQPFPQQYETYDFLNATDMLVTDYSSIMFDYAVTGKKMILFAYDREEYLRDRGMYIDLDSLELPVVETVEELVAEFDRPNAGYPRFQRQFCSHDSERTALEVCRTMLTGAESVPCETLPRERENVLIFVGGVRDPETLEQAVKYVNSMDFEKYNYYLAFLADHVKKNTALLRELDGRVGYIPLQKGIDALLPEYLAKWMYEKRGWDNGWIEGRLRSLCRREIRKHFGEISFSHVIYYGGSSSFHLKMLSMMDGRVICHLAEYQQKKYDNNSRYRHFVDLLTGRRMRLDAVCVNQAFADSDRFRATKDRVAYHLMEAGHQSFSDVMEVLR